jgi:hypothetical protein
MVDSSKQTVRLHQRWELSVNTYFLFDETVRYRQRPAGCRLPEPLPFDPAGVIFPVQRITWEWWPFHLSILLIVHPVKGQWLNLSTSRNMKIGILVPTIRIKEKFADAP